MWIGVSTITDNPNAQEFPVPTGLPRGLSRLQSVANANFALFPCDDDDSNDVVKTNWFRNPARARMVFRGKPRVIIQCSCCCDKIVMVWHQPPVTRLSTFARLFGVLKNLLQEIHCQRSYIYLTIIHDEHHADPFLGRPRGGDP